MPKICFEEFKWRKLGPLPLAMPITSIWQGRGGYAGSRPFSPISIMG